MWNITVEDNGEDINLSVENNEVFINLSIEDQAAATAIAASSRAEAAKILAQQGAETSLEKAGIATEKASQASASETVATTKASEAAASESVAIAQAVIATTKASQATASETVATEKAGQALASEGIATTKASEASASATLSSTKATASEASATESTTQAGIATEKAIEADHSATTAATAAGTAITAKTDAETARDIAIEEAEQTALDRIATGDDRIATGEDRVQTGEDRVATGDDVIATGEDRTATGLDVIATGQDRAQTGEDRVATGLDKTATEQAKDIAVTKAGEANTSAVNSQDAFTNTQSLLVNFFDPSIIALNLRGISEGASFEIKLRKVQDDLDLLDQYGFSLVTIPSVTKAGKLYSVLPENGSGDFTVSRNGTKTVMGKEGFLKTVPANVPALEFNVDGSFKGVLVEPAATNLVLHSQNFNNWNKIGNGVAVAPIVTSNFGLSPEGTQNAAKVDFNLNGGVKNTDRSLLNISNMAATLGTIYTRSIWIKAATATDIGKTVRIITEGIGTHTIHTLTDSWVRVIYSSSAVYSSVNYILELRPTFTTNNIASALIWGAQLEAGSVATSYIQTTTATVTRPADVIIRTGAENLIGQVEGSVYVEVDYNLSISSQIICSLSDGTVNNSISIYKSGSNNFNVDFFKGGVSSATIVYVLAKSNFFTTLGKYKILFNYKAGNFGVFVNGVKLTGTPTQNANISDGSILNKINIGTYPANNFSFTNHIKNFALSKVTITDTQAITLTTL